MESDFPDAWDFVLDALKLTIDEEAFSSWLLPTRMHSLEGSSLVIETPDAVSRNWLASNFMGDIAAAAETVLGHPVDVAFKVRDGRAQAGNGAHSEAIDQASLETYRCSRLNGAYTFDSFVVGESNRFAQRSARHVAELATSSINPLFIYGGSGLGKTHLMHAIGNEALRLNPRKRVLYVTSEQFMNAYVDSVAKKTSIAFRNFYRNVHLLLVDDIQYFMGRDGTQYEFFHTFNTLYEMGRTIVVTCDRAPKDLENIEERLRSRFEWGLMADIHPPDLETRLAILRNKAESMGLDLPYELAIFIAERIKTNIRKLEGALSTLKGKRDHSGVPITRELLIKFIEPYLVGEEPRKISPEGITRIVCEYFDVDVSDLIGKSRLRKHAMPRHLAMYLCRQVGKISFPEIGKFYGNRDHSSVMHACRKIETRVNADLNAQNLATYLTKKIFESSAP